MLCRCGLQETAMRMEGSCYAPCDGAKGGMIGDGASRVHELTATVPMGVSAKRATTTNQCDRRISGARW